MASSFSHKDDIILRVGDYVRTLDVTHSNPTLDVSQAPRASSRLGRQSPSPNPRSLRTTESASAGLPPVASHPNINKVTRTTLAREGQERSSTAAAFDADTSSIDAWWKSMTRGTWLEEREKTHSIGVIRRLDPFTRVADIVIWKKGDKCFADTPKKPMETLPLNRLQKLSQAQFNDLCRKQFMHEVSYHLKLRGEGYDESAPFALIAYNNRVISELIGKIDTTAKLSLQDLKVRRPRGPGDLIHGPIPVLCPIEDPLANARAELEALQSSGLVQKGRRSRSAKLASKRNDDDAIHGTERTVSRRDTSSDQQQPSSFLEQTVDAEKAQISSQLRIASAPMHSASKLRAVTPLMPDSFFPRREPTASPTHQGNGSRVFLSEVDLHTTRSRVIDDDRSLNASIPKSMCIIVDVRQEGIFLLRPSRTAEPPFLAKLHNVELWRDATVSTLLSALSKTEVTVIPKLRDCHGVCVCDIKVGNECLAEKLLRDGLATLTVSLIDQASSTLGAKAAQSLEPLDFDEPDDRITKLTECQQAAVRDRVGLWRLAGGGGGGNAQTVEGVHLDLPHIIDGSGQDDEHLPSLFQAFESSSYFRNKLMETINA